MAQGQSVGEPLTGRSERGFGGSLSETAPRVRLPVGCWDRSDAPPGAGFPEDPPDNVPGDGALFGTPPQSSVDVIDVERCDIPPPAHYGTPGTPVHAGVPSPAGSARRLDPAAVLGGAGPPSGEADGVGIPAAGDEYLLRIDLVVPRVAEVVTVPQAAAGPRWDAPEGRRLLDLQRPGQLVGFPGLRVGSLAPSRPSGNAPDLGFQSRRSGWSGRKEVGGRAMTSRR